MDCGWKWGVFFFIYEAGKDKEEENKWGFCGQCYEVYVSQVGLNIEFSSQGSWVLSWIQLQWHSSRKTRLGSPFPSALCGSRSCCLLFSPWQLQQLEVLSPLLCLSHLIFSTTGPVFPLTAPREVLLGRVPFLREVEEFLTRLQQLQGCKERKDAKVWDPYCLASLMTSGVVLSLVFMETSGVPAFPILLTQKPYSTWTVLY